MEWHDPRYWYFVTQVDMGQTMSLTPRCPIGMDDDEPVNNRICVAPSAANCMTAINLNIGKIYVYRTRRKVKARKPYNVYDSHVTNEHWLHTKTRFTLVEVLNVTRYYNWFSVDDETGQRRHKSAIRSWCKRRDQRLALNKKSDQRWKSKNAFSIKTMQAA